MEEEKDKIEGMSYKHIDKETGKEIIYGVSYSQELLKKIDEDLKKGNRLKKILLVAFVLAIIVGILIFTGTGTIGQLARYALCR